MKKGFILGFVVAIAFVGVAIAAFMLGKNSAGDNDNSNKDETTVSADNTQDNNEKETANGGDEMADIKVDDVSQENDVYITRVVSGENWEEGNQKCYKFEIFVKNTYKEQREIKEVIIDNIPVDSKIGDAWNGKLELDGTKIRAKFEDYNKIVQPEAESSFGFIIRCPKEFDISNSTIIAK